MSAAGPAENPYPGPQPFRRGQRLFGRDVEVAELARMLIGERLVLLFSPSGAGKTSLIEAGLAPALEADGFAVMPTIRAGGLALGPTDLPAGANRHVLSTLLSLERRHETPRDAAALAGLDLTAYGAELLAETDARERDLLLVFDQFEEVLTADPMGEEPRRAFFAQLSRLLGNRAVRALIALREEFVGGLTPYLDQMANRPRRHFRLDPLRPANAELAIVGPAATVGVAYEVEALALLKERLSQALVRVPGEGLKPVSGEFVEPMHLQVVCDYIWRGLAPAPGATITRAQIEALPILEREGEAPLDTVDAALRSYYDRTMEAIAGPGPAALRAQRRARDWIERHLISGELRGQALEGDPRSAPPSPELPARLIDAYLMRREERRKLTWFELSHDRLVRPIVTSNARWRAEKLSLAQQRARQWAEGGRPASLLLRGDDLAQAELWERQTREAGGEVEPDELDLIVSSRRERERERQEARERSKDMIQALAARAIRQIRLGDSDERAARLAFTAYEESRRVEYEGLDLVDAALRAVLGKELFTVTLPYPGVTLTAVALSRDGTLVAAGADDGAVRVWDLRRPGEPPQTLPPDRRLPSVLTLAFDADPAAPRLAAGYADGALRIWRPSGPAAPLAEARAHGRATTAVAFEADGAVCSAGLDGHVLRWAQDLKGSTLVGRHEGGALALAAHAGALASGGADGQARIWPRDGREPASWPLPARVGALAFGAEGAVLAAGAGEQVYLLDARRPDAPVAVLGGYSGAVISLAFTPDQALLASGGAGGQLRLWSFPRPIGQIGLAGLRRQAPHPRDLRARAGAAGTVAMSADGGRIAAGGSEGLRLWSLGRPAGVPVALQLDGPVVALAFADRGARLAALSQRGVLASWAPRVAGPPPPLDQQSFATAGVTAQAMPTGLVAPQGLAADALGPTCVAFDERRFFTADLAGGRGALRPAPSAPLRSAALAPGGAVLALAGAEQSVDKADLARQTVQRAPRPLGHSGTIVGTLAAADGRALALSAVGAAIMAWELGGEAVVTFTHSGRVRLAALAADGRRLVAAAEDGALLLWEWAHPDKPVELLLGPEQPITALALSADGAVAAAGCADGTIWLWHADLALDLPIVLERHGAPVTALAFSPHQRTLASGDGAGEIRIWITDVDLLAGLVQNRVVRPFTPDELALFLGRPDAAVS